MGVRKMRSKNNVKQQVISLFDLIPDYTEELARKVDLLITEEVVAKYRRIYFVATGDSYSACLAGIRIFESIASKYAVKFIPIKATDYTRYLDFTDINKNETLAIIVSVSGNGSRVVEAVKRSLKVGVDTLLITSNENSYVYNEVTMKLFMDVPDYEFHKSALKTYYASVVSLYLMAAKFSDQKNEKKALEKMLGEINHYTNLYKEKYTEYETLMSELAEKFVNAKSVTVIGDKDEEPSCRFAVSKVIELTGIHSRWDDSEEWGHINYFNNLSGLENPVFFFGNSKHKNISRIMETIEQTINIEKPAVLFADENFPFEKLNKKCKVIKLPKSENSYMQPLCSYLPMTLFAYQLSELLEEEPFRGNLVKEEDNTIVYSKVVVFGEKPNEQL